MGKVIKFGLHKQKEEHNNNTKNSKENIKSFGISNFETNLRKALEDYITSVFAVKQVLGMDITYKENKNDIGIIGVIIYEHKRRAGNFVANFISHAVKENNNIRIIEVAFEVGEPELYKQILNILKAKKVLPDIIE